MACRHLHETTGHQPPATHRPPGPPARSTCRWRWAPITAGDHHAPRPAGAPPARRGEGARENASAPAPPDLTDAAWTVPSQLLTLEALQRPLESALPAPVAVVDDTDIGTPLPERLFQGLDDELGAHVVGHRPADAAAREAVHHDGEIEL